MNTEMGDSIEHIGNALTHWVNGAKGLEGHLIND